MTGKARAFKYRCQQIWKLSARKQNVNQRDHFL